MGLFNDGESRSAACALNSLDEWSKGSDGNLINGVIGMSMKPVDDSSFPTNIEQATPDFIRKNLENWDNQILKSRAARLRISERDAGLVDSKPLFLLHAEETAKLEKCPLETVLKRYADELVCSNYPTVECFLPDEIAEYIQCGTLPENRLGHTDVCSACSMLLAASLPGDFDNVLAGMTVADHDLQPESIGGRIIRIFTDYGAIFLPALLLILVYVALRFIDRQAALQTVFNDPLAWGFLLGGTFFYVLVSKALVNYQKARWWSTAAIIGLVLLGFGYVNIRQIRSAKVAEVARAFKWAQDQTESLALRAIQQRQTTGQFPNAKQASSIIGSSKTSGTPKVSVETKESESAATYAVKYIVTTADLKGQIVVEINPDGGTIKWEDGSNVLAQVQVLTATVKALDDGTSDDTVPTVTFVNGASYRVSFDELPQLQPGTHVVAAVDPSTSSVQSCLAISKNFPPPRPF